MKSIKTIAGTMCVALLVSGCGGMNLTTKGALIGTGGGAAAGAGLGALIGKLTGNTGKGAIIGTAVGTAVGATAGTLIGHKMQKAKEAAAKLAEAEMVKDQNGLDAVKVTLDNAILFQVGKADLQQGAKNTLSQLAATVLNQNTDVDVAVVGFASSDGDEAKNLTLSQSRAASVTNYLLPLISNKGQIKHTTGLGEDPAYLVMKNGVEDMKASRRVEIYLLASQEMVEKANAGTLQ